MAGVDRPRQAGDLFRDLGNGDPACLVNDKSATRPAFHGLVLGVVQGTLDTGTVTVTASAEGIIGVQTVTLQSSAPPTPKKRL